MSNQIQAPCGEYAISTDVSTKGWKHIRHMGALVIQSSTMLSVIPPRGGKGYAATLHTIRGGDVFAHEFRQLGGDGRVVTIYQPVAPNAPGYDITFLDNELMDFSTRIVMNSLLLPLMAWLRTTVR